MGRAAGLISRALRHAVLTASIIAEPMKSEKEKNHLVITHDVRIGTRITFSLSRQHKLVE